MGGNFCSVSAIPWILNGIERDFLSAAADDDDDDNGNDGKYVHNKDDHNKIQHNKDNLVLVISAIIHTT